MEESGSRTVKMALAPAMNAIACSVSEYSMRPAAKRMMELRFEMPREGPWVQNTSIRENRERIAGNKERYARGQDNARGCDRAEELLDRDLLVTLERSALNSDESVHRERLGRLGKPVRKWISIPLVPSGPTGLRNKPIERHVIRKPETGDGSRTRKRTGSSRKSSQRGRRPSRRDRRFHRCKR